MQLNQRMYAVDFSEMEGLDDVIVILHGVPLKFYYMGNFAGKVRYHFSFKPSTTEIRKKNRFGKKWEY